VGRGGGGKKATAPATVENHVSTFGRVASKEMEGGEKAKPRGGVADVQEREKGHSIPSRRGGEKKRHVRRGMGGKGVAVTTTNNPLPSD